MDAEIIDGDQSGPGALAKRMGITIDEAAPERIVGSMPVDGNTQPYGLLHGGASCVLAETLGSIGAVRDGVVTGVATPLRLGRTVVSYEVVISDGAGERVCTARLTCVLLRS